MMKGDVGNDDDVDEDGDDDEIRIYCQYLTSTSNRSVYFLFLSLFFFVLSNS